MRNIPFTPEEDLYIKSNYLTIPAKQIARDLKRSACGVRYRVKVLKLVIPDETIAEFQQRYKKGNVPFTKGKRQEDYMSDKALQNVKEHLFKTGETPKNALYDGAITTRINKHDGTPYKWIRVKSKWVQLHRYLWLKSGKEIPEGNIIVFTDKNTLNCVLSNLECITRGENLRRNREEWFYSSPAVKYNDEIKNNLKAERIKERNKIAKALRQKEIAAKAILLKKSAIKKDEKNWSNKYLSSSKIKIPDTSNLISFRINSKTIIQVKPGTDIEKVKQQYSSLSNLKYA